MQETDINARIRQLCDARGWTVYRLAKESGITYSTLCTMLTKSNLPSIPTLSKICSGLGITMSDFFNDGNNSVLLTAEECAHIAQWKSLTEENRIAAEKYIHFLLLEQK